MPTLNQGPLLCTLFAQASTGVAWTNPDNITTDAATPTNATAIFSFPSDHTQYLVATGFGFTLPTAAIPSGFQFSLKHGASSTSTNFISDHSVLICVGNVLMGIDHGDIASAWQASNGSVVYQVTYGDASDSWGVTPTATDVNDNGFGFGMSARASSGVGGEVFHLYCCAFYATVYYASGPSNGGVTAFQRILLFPMAQGIFAFDPTQGYADLIDGSSYTYRVEELALGRTPTISRILITYTDLGVVTPTFTLTGNNDNQEVVTATATQKLGNTVPTGRLMTQEIFLNLTAENQQLTIERAPGDGPLAISKIMLCGRVEVQSYT